MKSVSLLVSLVGVVILIISGCVPVPALPEAGHSNLPTVSADGSLPGTAWVLTRYGPADEPLSPLPESAPTLAIDHDLRISGNAGCNVYFGSLRLDGAELGIHGVGRTLMACDGPVMVIEDAYLDALTAADGFGIEGGQLTFRYGDGRGELVFVKSVAESYEGPEWLLTTFIMGEVASSVLTGSEITLDFQLDSDGVSGSAGCNRYNARVDLSAGHFIVGGIAATRMACESQTMEQEAAYLAALQAARRYTIESGRLTLSDADGRQLLVFAAPKS